MRMPGQLGSLKFGHARIMLPVDGSNVMPSGVLHLSGNDRNRDGLERLELGTLSSLQPDINPARMIATHVIIVENILLFIAKPFLAVIASIPLVS